MAGARVFSVCTGALLLGAAGLLRERRATTHWASFHLLPWFGATPVDERVLIDGDWIFAAGVTSGIDGALRFATELRGEDAAKAIQLHMVCAPEPPFDSGTPATAPKGVWTVFLENVKEDCRGALLITIHTAAVVAGTLAVLLR